MGLVPVEHMVLAHAHHQVARGDVLHRSNMDNDRKKTTGDKDDIFGLASGS
jgi:hypothetical protein